MKAAIFCGSRTLGPSARPAIDRIMSHYLRDADEEPCVVIDGMAPGADELFHQAAYIASEATFEPAIGRGPSVFMERFPAEWKKYGKPAGYLRNELMANRLDALRKEGAQTFVIAMIPDTTMTVGTGRLISLEEPAPVI